MICLKNMELLLIFKYIIELWAVHDLEVFFSFLRSYFRKPLQLADVSDWKEFIKMSTSPLCRPLLSKANFGKGHSIVVEISSKANQAETF